ncbi:MAG: ATP-binding cassette domain-containing protein [Myxococcota bacterium]
MLEVRSLTKQYAGGVRALDDVNLEIGEGVFGLLGANGAGKSTLMRTLATLQHPDAGEVRLDGVDVFRDVRALRRQLGYLPQDLGVPARVSAREMLETLAGLSGIPSSTRRDLVAERLEAVNLTEAADRDLDGFSGGMRQRFGIAAATLGDPRLLIVDEPTAGLDPTERRRFQTLLAAFARDRILVLSSHIVEDVAGLCSRMAMLDGGRIVAEGTPESLVRDLDARVYRARVEPKDVDSIRARFEVLSIRPDQGCLALRVYAETSPGPGFEAVAPDLEDFFEAQRAGLVGRGAVTGRGAGA